MSTDETQVTAGSHPHARDTAISLAWIAVLLIIAGVFWVVTQPARNRTLVRSVNRVLEQSGDLRRLGEPSSYGGSGFFGMGTRFTMISLTSRLEGFSEGTEAVIFLFMGEGAFFPCAAVINLDGTVLEFIPLNSYGSRVLRRVSPALLDTYVRRIEGNRL